MRKSIIKSAQDYLTHISEDRAFQIVNIELLLRRHPRSAVISFLNQLRTEYKKELSELIKNNKTDPKIDELISKIWRLRMCINTIKNAKEVKDAA